MLEDQEEYMYYGLKYEPDTDRTELGENNTTWRASLEIFQSRVVTTAGLNANQGEAGRKGTCYQLTTNTDFQHKLYLTVTEGNLGRAPVREPRQVLEVASGTGIWAIEYATAHPACHVTGTDISAIQHAHSLPNLNFVLHDFEKDAWPAQCGRDYDYIHLRHTLICFDSTPAVLRRAFELLRPGGWIELYEPNATFVRMGKTQAPPLEGTAYAKWASLVIQVARSGGRDWTKTVHCATWLREAGFVNVTEKRFGLPMNSWPKDERLKQIGRLSLKNELALVDSLGPALRKAVHDEEEAHAIEEGAKRELQDPNMHVLREMFNMYAQKPIET